MSTQVTQSTHQSQRLAPHAGCWRLEAGRALSLAPASAGVLRVARGRVWVTIDVRHGDAQAAGDVFLVPGRRLVLQAGQRAVLESWGTEGAMPADFSWDPLPQAQVQDQAPGLAVRTAGQWQQAVVQPMRDLGAALGLAGAAIGRLALGVVTLLLHPLRGRWPQARQS